ncbi:hypothetical protein WL80_29645 [Burkholderia ubonensis]|uniref:hypothetical protein n=1 Tax=Burkholderia ubonensis TaxID=101571 RepID=UPI0007579951|nr:hypothetical protein [Burkholderia ubonensis]KWF01812.1 hypothetical protein WL80_29645 [Burkholderia ubonensis]
MLESNEEVKGDGRAIALSLQYLEVVERNLGIEYDSQGQPICVPSSVTQEALFALKTELRELLSGEMAHGAIGASKEFGEEHVQSVAFGHASDFDVLAKIGFLFSERVVLWDIISSRVLVGEQFDETTASVVAELACNLLLLRPVVELGGAIILPHPLGWSEAAVNVARDLAGAGSFTSAEFGLAMALVAIDEGLSLHPYTLPVKQQQPQLVGNNGANGEQGYSEKTRKFSLGAAELMNAVGFEFLRDSKLTDFYSVIASSANLQSELGKTFSRLEGLSPLQTRKELTAIQGELRKLGDARAKALSAYGIDGVVATFGLAFSAGAQVTATAGATLFGLLGVAATAITVTRRWLARPQKNVVVQVFSALQSAQPFALEYATEIPQLSNGVPEVAEDIKEHVAAVTEAHWTEEAHRYLEGLPESVAARVLESLTPTQIGSLVNHRHCQQDYIGDYLAYIWEANPNAFWSHIEATFTSEDGMLLYDSNNVHEVLTYEDMPITTWATLLHFFPNVYGKWIVRDLDSEGKGPLTNSYEGLLLEKIAEVMRFQLTKSKSKGAKQAVFRVWLGKLDGGLREKVDIFLKYLFPEGMPTWIELL